MAERLIQSARRMELRDLSFACNLCAAYDYRMKSTSAGDEELLRELLARLAVGS
jgi:hypothetical protein